MFSEPDIQRFRRNGDTMEVVTEPRKRSPIVKRMWENNEERTKAHALNFVESVRARKTPNADIEIAHRSTSIARLGNNAMKTGQKKLRWDAKKEDFLGASAASVLLTRHLRKPWDLIKL